MNRAKHTWIQTYSGIRFWIDNPREEDIDIIDVAHSLSNQCRYAGQLLEFFSISQHSVICSHNVERKHAKWALMHDASEAYLCDLPRPIKNILPKYRALEEEIQRVIAKKFHLCWPIPEQVIEADLRTLATEKRDILKPSLIPWQQKLPPPFGFIIKPWPSRLALAMFIKRFVELFGPTKKYRSDNLNRT